MSAESFYVRRSRAVEHIAYVSPNSHGARCECGWAGFADQWARHAREASNEQDGYVGPIPWERAEAEADAWRSCGWSAEVLPVTPELRRLVNARYDEKKCTGA
jgi:hypothetical protein